MSTRPKLVELLADYAGVETKVFLAETMAKI